MLRVAGENKARQLGVDPNNKSIDGSQIVYPPDNFKLDTSSLLSFSVYSTHTVWITCDGKAHAIGDNTQFKISKSLPEENIKESTIFEIQDSEGKTCTVLSAICGINYTLYLIQCDVNNKSTQLAYSHSENKESPIFLNLSGRNPIALYGGHSIAAAIDSDGAIIIINNAHSPQYLTLPSNKKSVQLACGNKYIFSLSSDGKVFMSHLKSDSDGFEPFTEVSELRKVNISQISGTHHHFFAISDEGVVYCRGRNSSGCLGTGHGIDKTKKFIQVTNLLNCRIKSAYAGCDHSLFQTEDGKIIACGNNCYGEIPLSNGPSEDDVFLPIDTDIIEKASFCIAGEHLSAVFVGCSAPPNMPNKKVEKGIPVSASPCPELEKFIVSNNNTSTAREKETVETSQSKCCLLI